jgi:hypothetical protein
MTQEKKVQTAAVMDVTGVERAAQDAVRAATKMADGIAKEGERAGKGIEAMGDGAQRAERSVDAATKSISDRLRRLTRDSQRELASIAATSAGGSGSAAAVEYEATLRGANVWIKPMKFALSLGVFALTTAWFVGHLLPVARRLRAVDAIVWVLIGSAVIVPPPRAALMADARSSRREWR